MSSPLPFNRINEPSNERDLTNLARTLNCEARTENYSELRTQYSVLPYG